MSDYMPMDIVEQVLLRLPMKPLLRCLSICKTWYNLITSTYFVFTHMDFTKSLNNSTRILMQDHSPLWWVKRNIIIFSDDKAGTFEEYFRFGIPVQKSTHYLHLVVCCNGLICLADNKTTRDQPREVVLWNPMIGRTLRLPKPDYGFKRSVFGFTFGFVFDHIGNDYKVLRLWLHEGFGEAIPTRVEVFRLSTGLWEFISYKVPFKRISHKSLQVDLKGIAHWIGKDYNGGFKIITFDVHEEVFGSIELPFDVVKDDENHCKSWQKYLFVFEESLFLICQVITRDVFYQNKWKFDVWKMGEYNVVESWNRVHAWVFDESLQPLCFRKNGEILWVTKEEKLISTNLKDASVIYRGIPENTIDVSSCLYVESLILLDKSLSSGVDGQKVEILQE